MIYFTADLHLNHEKIIEFCDRPYKNAEHMNDRLIAHEKWKHKWIEDKLVINVGVDVWNFYPCTQQEITVYADKCIKEK